MIPVKFPESNGTLARGRTPLVPVEYETAVKALSTCCTLDETKYWSDKADALAAWAKIYHSGETLRKAKCLKLHAFRRMGQLAQEINPRKSTAETGGRGSVPGSGPRMLLRSHGLSEANTDAARMLGQITERKFQSLLKRPMAPATYRYIRSDDGSPWHTVNRAMLAMRAQMRRFTPAQVPVSKGEAENARAIVTELTEWLDAFEQRLPAIKLAKPL